MTREEIGKLYPRWVAANAVGEMVGLGLTLGLGFLYFSATGEPQAVMAVLTAFAVAVASGVIEATVVGILQWRAMRPWFPGVTRFAWWRGTLIGALAAYVLGYLPSTLMELGEAAGGPAAAEPPQGVVLLLAAGMGLAGGAVLSFGQYPALKGLPGAKWWIPANMLAWAPGMAIIFWAIDAAQSIGAQQGQPLWQPVLILAAALLAAGAVVGAIHGMFLLRIARRAGAVPRMEREMERGIG